MSFREFCERDFVDMVLWVGGGEMEETTLNTRLRQPLCDYTP